jgi:septum formation protein
MVPNLVLASNSPRRRELLGLTGWQFSVRPVNINEDPLPGEPPADYVLRLAADKSRAAAHASQPGQLILTADTTVADGNTILGKPVDAADARDMLTRLGGREHWVYTAIGVSDPNGGRLVTDLCATRVWMRPYTIEEIEGYIASGDPFDKAGAYAIQHPGFHPVERIEGCYACVMGLPVCHVIRVLARFGLTPPNPDVTAACPQQLKMDSPCPNFERILGGSNHGAGLIDSPSEG